MKCQLRPSVESLEERNTPALIISQIPPSSLSGFVVCDENGNGVRDAGDHGLAGVVITLYKGSQVAGTTTTSANGAYHFRNLSPGWYTIVEGAIPNNPKEIVTDGPETLGRILDTSPVNWGKARQDDAFRNIRLGFSQAGVNYNFLEQCEPRQTETPRLRIQKFISYVPSNQSVPVGPLRVTSPQDPDLPQIDVSEVTFTYRVTNPGTAPLANVIVLDDAGTANSTFFGTPPTPFNPTFTGGDTNGNQLLDPGEVWTYAATVSSQQGNLDPFTLYHNVVTVTGRFQNRTLTDTDDCFYALVTF